jgi:predicted DNA-binding protein with PD1-like motif
MAYAPFRVRAALVLLLACLPARALAQTGASRDRGHKAFPAAPQTGGPEGAETTRLKIYALRLTPKQDLRKQIELFARQRKISAGFILTAVGSLQKAALRLADQKDSTTFEGKYEIVSLTGTLSPDGVHLHVSLSDSTGKTIGGHLTEGCEIYTTAEIVIADAVGLLFTREQDAETGYKELKIRKPARSNKRRG